MKRYHLILLIYFSQLFSCNNIVEIDMPEIEKKLVVNCLFSPDQPFRLNLSLNKGNTDTANYFIPDAFVEITDEKGLKLRLNYEGKGFYSVIGLKPQKGISYTLKIEINGLKTISASSKIPITKTSITEIESKSGYRTETMTGMGDKIKIPVQQILVKILHDLDQEEFMGFSIVDVLAEQEMLDSTNFSTNGTIFYAGYLNSNDPAIVAEGLESYDEHTILLFKDDLFAKPTYLFSFDFQNRTESKYWTKFLQFSPEAFKYLKSWIIHEYTQSYDFWEIYEPIPLFTNIENGYGIFAGYTSEIFETYPDSTQVYSK